MSKTIKPITYDIAAEWVHEYLNKGKKFSVADIMEKLPLNEYVEEQNFIELSETLYNFILDKIEYTANEENVDLSICEDLNNEIETNELKIKEDDILQLTIPNSFLKKLNYIKKDKEVSSELGFGILGNEIIFGNLLTSKNESLQKIIIPAYNFINTDLKITARNYFDECKNLTEKNKVTFLLFIGDDDFIHILVDSIE